MRLGLIIALALWGVLQAQLAVHGKTVYTMAGDPIQDGVVLVKNGKIEAVGKATEVKIPEGYRVVKANIVTPGLIDTHSVVGLGGILNSPHDQDQLEKSAPMQPELRALDAYNIREPLVGWLRGFGITTVNTGHAPASLISGQTMVVKTAGNNVDDAALVETAMVATTFGDSAVVAKGSPGTRSKIVSMLRNELVRVQNAMQQREVQAKKLKDEGKDPEPAVRNIRDEMYERLLKRELPILITAHRHQDILSALRVAKEFNLHLILDGAAEAHLILDKIKKANVHVIVHPLMYRAWGEKESLSMETPALLKKAGIPFTFQSGYESYVPKTRVVLFEAAIAIAYGLDYQTALAALTIDAAKILGVANRIGSLEVGKDADIAMYDGDPFEYTSHCTGVIIDGEVVSEEKR